MTNSILKIIQHYQQSIERSIDDEQRLLHCIKKLYELPIKVEHLQETGVGKTVNSLRKFDRNVGVAAKSLVSKWKAMVAAEEEDIPIVQNNNVQYSSQNPDFNSSEHMNINHLGNDTNMQHNLIDNSKNGNSRTKYEHQEEIVKLSTTSSNRLNDRSHNFDSHSEKTKHEKHHRSGEKRSIERKKDSDDPSNDEDDRSESINQDNWQPTGNGNGEYELEDDEDEDKLVIDTNKDKHDECDEDLARSEHRKSSKHRHNKEISRSSTKHRNNEYTHIKNNNDEYNSSKKHRDKKSEKHRSRTDDKKRDRVEEKHQHIDESDVKQQHEKRRDKYEEGEDILKEVTKSIEKEISLKHRERSNDKHRDKNNEKHIEKYREKSGEKNRDRSDEKRRDKSIEQNRDKNYESNRTKICEKNPDKESKSREKTIEKTTIEEIQISTSEEKYNGTNTEQHRDRKADKSRHQKNHKRKSSDSSEEQHRKKHKQNKEHRKNGNSATDDGDVSPEERSHKSKKQKVDSSSAEENDNTSDRSHSKVAKRSAIEEGIDSSMGTSFEEALGLIAGPKNSKATLKSKQNKVNGMNSSTSESSSSRTFAVPTVPVNRKKTSETPELLASTIKLAPLEPDIGLELPAISPNYKPMPLNPTVMECVFASNGSSNRSQRPRLTDEEALAAGISSKTIRTKVYSGARSGILFQVPSLFDLCIRMLQKNIDALEYTGGVPFEVLKAVLERATPEQLLTFENYNPYLMDDTDTLWQHHCMRRYRSKKRLEMETWRDMFLRCKDEQDERLNMLTENIKQSQKQITLPIRKTQLAYVDDTVKPPRSIIRKQNIYGTKSKLVATPAARVSALSNVSTNIAKVGDERLKSAAGSRDTAQAVSARPRKAPLMQKTLQLMKGRFKR